MEDEADTVAAVQCSVIQYCTEPSLTEPESCGNHEIPPEMKDTGAAESPELVNGVSQEEETSPDEVPQEEENPPTEVQQEEEIPSTEVLQEEEIPPTEVQQEEEIPPEEPLDQIPAINEEIILQTETDVCNEVEVKDEESKAESLEEEEQHVGDMESIEENSVMEETLGQNSLLEESVDEGKREREEKYPPEVVPRKRKRKGKKRRKELVNGEVKDESMEMPPPPPPPPLAYEEYDEEDEDEEEIESEDDEIVKPRRRGRCKKNPEQIPSHLAPDIALGYRMLLKFVETPLFSIFLRPSQPPVEPAPAPADAPEQITCLNQIKKKFDENLYARLSEFTTDVRAMLNYVYMSPTSPSNQTAVKRALRLEQMLEQLITQLPNYLRPQCSFILSDDEVSNSPKKIRINKGGGFVSLLLEKAEMLKAEKDREKRKVLAEERKQLKEEQDKDVQDWEKNVLLNDQEEDIKSMWELPQIGHFIHLCANILNIGDVSQYEVERMLLMPQCSDTLDLLITALLSNSLMRAKLDRTPSMPYNVWSSQVRSRVNAWYKAYHREYRNPQKVFEEIGVEPEFWDVVGPDHSPLDYFLLHEIPLIQRVWILKTLCDVDFVRKKTVYDNIRVQLLEELQGNSLGVDRHGNRYIHFPQFGQTALRIYKQSPYLEEGMSPSDLVESQEAFEERKGEITIDKVFRDIWDVGPKVKVETPVKKGKKKKKHKQPASVAMKVKIEPTPPKSLRLSARAKRKVYVDSSDSESSDTDLATLKNKLNKPEKTFISLTVFRLPRDKVKPVNVKKSYYCRKLEREEAERLRLEGLEANKDKMSVEDEEASESMDRRFNEDDDLEGKDNFSVKNLENLKMVFKKEEETENDNATDGSAPIKEEEKFKYTTPANKLPDASKFYCVVDSVDGLRQLITQFASDENDLEIINRSSRSGKKASKNKKQSPSCEVRLIERLQALVEELEAWELDFLKTSRAIRDKMYKEYTNFINRPQDFVHPNEAYWLKYYEEPPLVVPTAPEPVVPEVAAPVEAPVTADEAIVPPVSPLGGLRPRTRTRQQLQHQSMVKVEMELMDKDMEEYDEEMESSESDDNWEMPVSKKKRRRMLLEASPKAGLSNRPRRSPKKSTRLTYPDSSDSSDKSKKALFWSSRSTDPSEELNWEANRQRILEKHNSPKKVLPGDIESEMSEVENALRMTATGPSKNRTIPAPLPGNKKPYFSSSQLKTMAPRVRKDDEIQVVGQRIVNKPQTPRRPPIKLNRPQKKSAGTQSSGASQTNNKMSSPSTPASATTARLPTPVLHEEYFITDGSVYIKIDQSFVPELIENQDAVRKFANQLDLNQKIQIVKKKVEGTVPTPKTVPSSPPPLRMQEPPQPRPSAAAPGLRFIRPQNVAAPPPVQFVRPPQRLPQQNVVYLQAGPQVRPGMPAVRPAGVVQMVPRSTAPGNPQEATSVDVVSMGTNQVGYIQMPGGRQPVQFVQVSQAQNMLATSGANATPSFVRLGNSGQLIQLAPAGTMAFKPQTSSADTPVSAGNQMNLVQLQGLPGEPISYMAVQGAKPGSTNLVQIQSPIKGGNFVQMSSPSQPNQPRFVQVQGTSASAIRPQTNLVQVYAAPRMQTQMRPQTVQVRTGLMPISQQQRPIAVASSGQQTNVVSMATGQPTMNSAVSSGGNVLTIQQDQMGMPVSYQLANSPKSNIISVVASSSLTSSKSRVITTNRPLTSANTSPVLLTRLTSPVRPAGPIAARPSGAVTTVVQGNPRAMASVRPRAMSTLVSLSPQALQQQQQQQVQFSPRAAQPQNLPLQLRPTSSLVSLSPQALQQQRIVQVSSGVTQQQQKVQGIVQVAQGNLQQNMRTIIQQKTANLLPSVRPGMVAAGAGPRGQRPQLIRLQMPIRAANSAGGKQMVTQVVQMTGASGKPEYYQIQAPAGQALNIVQVVSGAPSNITQGKPVETQNMVQIQAAPTSIGSTNSPQLLTMPRLIQQHHQPQQQQHHQQQQFQQGNRAVPASGGIRVISHQGQTVRLIANPGKPDQPLLVRSVAKPPPNTDGDDLQVIEVPDDGSVIKVETLE